MKVRTGIMLMGLSLGAGALGCAYAMSNKDTKNKANKLMNDALNSMNNKISKMN